MYLWVYAYDVLTGFVYWHVPCSGHMYSFSVTLLVWQVSRHSTRPDLFFSGGHRLDGAGFREMP